MNTFQPVVHAVDDRAILIHGESLNVLKSFPDNYFSAIVTDPPSSTHFMNKSWDDDKGGREQWVGWLAEIMREVYRTLKPGAHGVVWSLPRRQHWTALALEDAGFQIADCFAVLQCFGTGFPKSRNISQDIDRMAGAEREIVGERPWSNQDIRGNAYASNLDRERLKAPITAAATDEAKQWEGFGTALKPAYEPWILIRKPISEKNIALNVLKHGTGAMNLGACEVGRNPNDVPGWHKTGADGSKGFQGEDTFRIREMSAAEVQQRCGSKGRHAPNLVLHHSEYCVQIGTHRVKGCPAIVIQGEKDGGGYDVGSSDGSRRNVFEGYGDADGMEEVALWACVPQCPARILDARRGTSRYFPCFRYQSKPSRSEKEAGLKELGFGTLNRVNSGGLEEIELSSWYESVLLVGRVIKLVHHTLLQTREGSTIPESVFSAAETLLVKETVDGEAVAMLEQMATSTCELGLVRSLLNTALSWNSTLGTLWNVTNTFTTEMGTDLITALKILRSYVTETTPADTLKAFFESSEASSNAIGAVRSLNDLPALPDTIATSAVSIVSENIGEIKRRLRFKPVQVKNNHPTCKSIDFLRWLVRLVTPLDSAVESEGIVLDPFAGSFSVGCASVLEGAQFCGIEQGDPIGDPRYIEIGRSRIEYWMKNNE